LRHEIVIRIKNVLMRRTTTTTLITHSLGVYINYQSIYYY